MIVLFTLTLFAICFYIWDYKIPALLILFFFMTSGFNLMPEAALKNDLFTKSLDYAIIIILGMVVIDSIYVKNYLKPDKLLWLIIIFYIFLGFCIIYNKYVVGTSWKEIIRTVRYNLVWIAYLIFRNLSKERLIFLMKCLFLTTVICSGLYILQIILNEHILNETVKYTHVLFGMKIPRFYNQPDMIHFFAFMAIYFNPYKRAARIITTVILVIALLGALHRSLFLAFILTVSIIYIIRLPRPKRIAIMSSIAIIGFIFVIFFGYRFANSRAIKDINLVLKGNASNVEAEDIDIEELQKSTFTFRVAHLLERNQYLLERPRTILFGAGLMTEDSKLTDIMFDFKVGLLEEALGKTAQLDTPDISYSILLMRYGYLGTLIILSLYIFLLIYFYKNYNNSIGLFSFAYFIVVIITSFFSDTLVLPISFLLPLIPYSIIINSKSEHESMIINSININAGLTKLDI